MKRQLFGGEGDTKENEKECVWSASEKINQASLDLYCSLAKECERRKKPTGIGVAAVWRSIAAGRTKSLFAKFLISKSNSISAAMVLLRLFRVFAVNLL